MQNYKVYFINEEVAEFKTMKEAKNYILSMLKVDKALTIQDFTIYGKIG